MYKKILVLVKVSLLLALFFVSGKFAFAEDININLTIRDESTVVFSGPVALPTAVTSVNDSAGGAHDIDPSSVLAALASADASSEDFEISNLTYFSSFNSLYLKCLTDGSGEKCDNWQYVVDGSYPFSSIDQNILSGGENVYIYFGPQNKITLSSNSITADDTLTVTAQNYDYENDAWTIRTGVTAGLTQPNPADPFSPIEIMTSPVDENGQATFSNIPAGSYNVGVKEDFYFPTEALEVTTPPPSGGGHGGGGHHDAETGKVLGATTKVKFDLEKALDFLIAQQKEDGSFGEDIYTDWSTIALVSGNKLEPAIKLIKHFGESKLIEGSSLTDYERHSMALMSLGLNPHNANGENYIEKIVKSFDGKQFGDLHEDNDDIFALIVLQNAGYVQDEKMIADDIDFVLSAQRENGSWDESIDMTGAGIEALAKFSESEEASANDLQVGRVKTALEKARDFLDKGQKPDGSWGNVSSTAWAIEGILALGEKPEDWRQIDQNDNKLRNIPFDYFGLNQDVDGGIKGLPDVEKEKDLKNRIWETAYAVKAYSTKTWNKTMQKFQKPEEVKDAGAVLGASTEKIPAPKKGATKPKLKPLIEIRPENTATVLNSLEENKTQQVESKNWFMKFINFIF